MPWEICCIFCLLVAVVQTLRQTEEHIKLVTFHELQYDLVSQTFQDNGLRSIYDFGSKFVASINADSSTTQKSLKNLKVQLGSKISVENNVIFRTEQLDGTCNTDTYDSPVAWHLNRINQIETLNFDSDFFQYNYSSHDNGDGVKAYVLDTGIYINHTEFANDRATFGFVADEVLEYDGTETDLNGHGTHVAGLIGGTKYGIAKDTELVAVKCLDKEGYGYLEDIEQGLEYIYNETRNNSDNMKVVVNLSFTTRGESEALETALEALNRENKVVLVAASGNDEDGSCFYMPGRYNEVINVGATTETDQLADFTNWGSCVKILAPGTNIQSAGITNENSTAVYTGTSFAAPLVTGAAARYLSYFNQTWFEDPLQVYLEMVKDATKGEISIGRPATVNVLLFVNCTDINKITTSTTKPSTTTSTTKPTTTPANKNTLGPGAIAGITVVSVGASATIIGVIVVLVKKHAVTTRPV